MGVMILIMMASLMIVIVTISNDYDEDHWDMSMRDDDDDDDDDVAHETSRGQWLGGGHKYVGLSESSENSNASKLQSSD